MVDPSEGSVAHANSRRLRYRCLLLDHDDTTVRGTEELHHPAHVESVRALRPDLEPCTLEEWFEKNHEPGVYRYLSSLFTPEQMEEEHRIWTDAMRGCTPTFYDGMADTLAEFRSLGGLLAVISHSPKDHIERNYEAHPRADEIRPDIILGWNDDPQRRKPSPWPALHVLEVFGVAPEEALVLDDLSPGVKMAKAAGVHVAASGWGHSVPKVEEYMKTECNFFFDTVEDFASFLLCKDETIPAPNDLVAPNAEDGCSLPPEAAASADAL